MPELRWNKDARYKDGGYWRRKDPEAQAIYDHRYYRQPYGGWYTKRKRNLRKQREAIHEKLEALKHESQS